MVANKVKFVPQIPGEVPSEVSLPLTKSKEAESAVSFQGTSFRSCPMHAECSRLIPRMMELCDHCIITSCELLVLRITCVYIYRWIDCWKPCLYGKKRVKNWQSTGIFVLLLVKRCV